MSALEITIRCHKKNKAFHTKYYMSDAERRQIIDQVGDPACMLYDYYLRMASIGEQELTDQAAAEYFGWSEQKAKRNRLALARAGFFRSAGGRLSDGKRTIYYYIGEDAVRDSLNQGS